MQNLVMIGQLLDLSTAQARVRAKELLEEFDLTDAAGRLAKTYSGGMRRRLDLSASLIGRPASSTSTSRPRASTRPSATTCGT